VTDDDGDEVIPLRGDEMAQIRRALGWTQAELASRLGRHKRYVANIESTGQLVPACLTRRFDRLVAEYDGE
jgi:transcriptional regulator with XRE-family HTH domain